MAATKSFAPSRKKLEKARREGDVAKSRELTAAIILSVGFSYLFLLFQQVEALVVFFQQVFAQRADFHTNNMLVYLTGAAEILFWLLAPFLVLISGAALFAELIQVGVNFSFQPLGLRFSRLGLLKGLKRILGLQEESDRVGFSIGFFSEAGRLAVYAGILSLACAFLPVLVAEELFGSHLDSAEQVLEAMLLLSRRMLLAGVAAYLGIGIFDFYLTKRKHTKRLGMDAEELKRELRESEGDPETSGMRKQLHREMIASAVMDGVRRARMLVVGKKQGN